MEMKGLRRESGVTRMDRARVKEGRGRVSAREKYVMEGH